MVDTLQRLNDKERESRQACFKGEGDCGKDPLKMPIKRSRERWLKICQVYIIQMLSWIG